MSKLITNKDGVVHMRDPRYATLWEVSGPQTGLSLLSAAFAEVDIGATSPRHWHEQTEEMYLILSGTGVMILGDDRVPVGPRDCVSIPIRLVHAIGNTGTVPLRMWVVTSPPYTDGDDFEVDC